MKQIIFYATSAWNENKLIHITSFQNSSLNYNELSQKTRLQSVQIAALCLCNIQCENLVFENSLCISTTHNSWFHKKGSWSVHSFNEDYISIPSSLVHSGSWGNLFHEIPGMYLFDIQDVLKFLNEIHKRTL